MSTRAVSLFVVLFVVFLSNGQEPPKSKPTSRDVGWYEKALKAELTKGWGLIEGGFSTKDGVVVAFGHDEGKGLYTVEWPHDQSREYYVTLTTDSYIFVLKYDIKLDRPGINCRDKETRKRIDITKEEEDKLLGTIYVRQIALAAKEVLCKR